MPTRPINYRAWALFSLFVWLHLSPWIYPFPWQQYAQIHLDAIDAVKNDIYLQPNDPTNRTAEEWEAGLISSTWVYWVIHTCYFSFGILFSWLLYNNSRLWPYLLGGLSMIFTLQLVPNIFELAMNNGSFILGMAMWGSLISKWIVGMELMLLHKIYLLFIWPLFGIPLLWISIVTILRRIRNVELVA